MKLIEQPSSSRHCKETARGLVSYRQPPPASPLCIRFERIEHAENNARALARIPAGQRRGKQRRPTKPAAHAQTPRASRGTLTDRWSTRPRSRSCDRIRAENRRPARSDVAGAGNGRRKFPGRVLMGPEQMQRRFLPIGGPRSTWRPRREPQTPRSSTGATWKSGTRFTRTTPRRTWSSGTGADGEEGKQFIVSAPQRGSSHKGERGQLSERTASESMGLVLDDPSACSAGPGLLGAQLIQSQLA